VFTICSSGLRGKRLSVNSAGGNSTQTQPNPTPTPPPQPSTVPVTERSAFSKIEVEDFNDIKSSTIQKIGTPNGGSGIGYIENGDWLAYKILTSETVRPPLRHWLQVPFLQILNFD